MLPAAPLRAARGGGSGPGPEVGVGLMQRVAANRCEPGNTILRGSHSYPSDSRLPGPPEQPLRCKDPAEYGPARDSFPSGDLADGMPAEEMVHQQASALGRDSVQRFPNQSAPFVSFEGGGEMVRFAELPIVRLIS